MTWIVETGWLSVVVAEPRIDAKVRLG